MKEKNIKKTILEGFIGGVLFILLLSFLLNASKAASVASQGGVLTTEGGSKIYLSGQSECIVEFNDYSVGKYSLDKDSEDGYAKSLTIRGAPPERITFDGYGLNGVDRIVSSVVLPDKIGLRDCFKNEKCLIGQTIESAKQMLQAYGTVFEVSQETYPEIMKNGIRYGLDLLDQDNNSAVLVYANEQGEIDSVQFMISNKSGAAIADDFINIRQLEPKTRAASALLFSEHNQFFCGNKDSLDVFYFADGTLSVKATAAKGNYIIYEFRIYGSMNQGFHGLFSTDRENTFAESLMKD